MASAGRAAANSKCAPTLGRGTSWSDLACVFTWSAAGLPGVCQGSGGRSGRQSATSGWSPAGARGRHPASGAASGRVRPRSGIRVWQTSNISLGSGMVRRGVRPPSGRIRRGLGTRVLLTCLGPADPRYWGGSCVRPWQRRHFCATTAPPRAKSRRVRVLVASFLSCSWLKGTGCSIFTSART